MEQRKNKSKEELREEMKRRYEVERQRQLVRERVFPAVYSACGTVGEAQVLLEYASSLVYQRATRKMYEMSTKDLSLVSEMKAGEVADKYKAFFESLDTLDVGQCIALLDQLKKGIVSYVERKASEAPLSDAKIEEIIEKSPQ